MIKSTITKTWIAGLATFAAGIVAALAGVFLMLAYGGTFTQVSGSNSYDFTPDNSGFFWFTVTLIVIGGLIVAAGGVVQLAAWVGGLFNSYLLPSKAWFLVLLFGGLLGFFFAPLGFAAMLAYVVAAPDGSAFRPTELPRTQPGALFPTA